MTEANTTSVEAVVKPDRPWDKPELAHVSGFRTATDDLAYKITRDEIRGTIPDGLRGIFLRNGPARNELAGKPFGHWFDGDGAVHTFRI
jgi:all-trans-8'-apo-beta-carotenal 15,15'-oxygenase